VDAVTGAQEVTLRQFIDSVWFRGMARGMMIVTPVLVGGFWIVWGIVVGAQQVQIDDVRTTVASVSITQNARASDAEAFQREVRAAISGITSGLQDVNEELDGVKVDVGVIRRLMVELRDQQLASVEPLSRPPFVAAARVPNRSQALQ
jgi:hypothetical protein